MNNTLYQFEKSPKKKGVCPICQQKNTFRFYEGLPRNFGKCERTNNCGAHIKPNQKELKEMGVDIEKIPSTDQDKQKKKIVYPDEIQLKCAENLNTPFHIFCREKLKIADSEFKKWNIGGVGNNTAFILVNIEGKPVNIKTQEFINGGENRNKSKNPVHLSKQPGEEYSMCLFGEHLLDEKKITCLVESEKTAFIAALTYPHFNWLATGGAHGLTDQKIEVLFNRKIYYLNDADKAGKENSTIKKLRSYKQDFEIVDLFPDRNDGYDLADAIIDGLKPEIVPTAKPKQDPATNTIADGKTTLSKREIEVESIEKYGFFERDSQYYIKKYLKNSSKDERISNFKMKLLYALQDGSDNVPHLFSLTKVNGLVSLLEIKSKDLFNQNSFAAHVLGLGGYNYNGQLNTLKNIVEMLYLECKQASYIASLGQSIEGDFYAFYNGVLLVDGTYIQCNQYGIVEVKDSFFYLASGTPQNIDNPAYSDDRKFKLVSGSIGLEYFAEKMYCIYGIEGLIGLCFTIASIHRDIIFKEMNAFPFLFLYGPKGSGKSTYINFFMSIFGDPLPETTSTSTQKAIERKFAQTNNNIQYIKEFSPAFEEVIRDILKNAYDGVGYSRAQTSQNNRTNTTVVRTGLVIDGNYFPTTDDALFSRLIFLTWNPKVTTESKQLIQELQDALKKGNSQLFSEIYGVRSTYKSGFSSLFRATIKEVKDLFVKRKIHHSEREVSHIAMMASVFKLSLNGNENSYSMFLDAMIESSLSQAQITNSIDAVNKFFEAMEVLYTKGVLTEKTHYIREQNTGFDYLFINYNMCQEQYAKYLRDTGERTIISKAELKQKLEFKTSSYYEYKDGVKYFQKKFGLNNQRCLVFDVVAGSFELLT